MVTNYSGYVYPNGEFTVGYSARKLQHDDVAPSKARYSPDEEWWAVALDVHGIEACLEARGVEEPLGSSSVPISHSRSPKGMKGISSNGRRMIRQSCYVLEKEFGVGRCGFGTLTLPELTPEDYVSVHQNWGNITRTFMQWATRQLSPMGIPAMIASVTEIQGKRYEQTGRPYFHLHFTYPARPNRSYQWYLPASQIRLAWQRAVAAFCTASYDFGASVDCVVVKKGLAQYLAKYLSKGGQQVEDAVRHGLPIEAVGHWWGWTSDLRERVSKATIRAVGLAETIFRTFPEMLCDGQIKWCTLIYIYPETKDAKAVGLAGVLDEGYLHRLQLEYLPKEDIP